MAKTWLAGHLTLGMIILHGTSVYIAGSLSQRGHTLHVSRTTDQGNRYFWPAEWENSRWVVSGGPPLILHWTTEVNVLTMEVPVNALT